MADPQKRTVTIKEVQGDPWQVPDTQKFYYTVVIESYPSEPIKFIQDKGKGAPAPEVGKSYEGTVYSDDKGIKFYPFTPRAQGGGRNYQPRDDKEIRAQMAVKAAAAALAPMHQPIAGEPVDMDKLMAATGQYATYLYGLVDELKGSAQVQGVKQVMGGGEPVGTKDEPAKPIDLSQIPF